jgi:hypothetical protein
VLEVYLAKGNEQNRPNMSQLRLIKTNELIINENEKLGEGEFGAVYAVSLFLIGSTIYP